MHHIFMGWDSRETTVYGVARHSLTRRSSLPVDVFPLQHVGLRQRGYFDRPWVTNGEHQMFDQRDGKPFSTEFAFTRFLTPHVAWNNNLTGWVLFCDCDFLFLSDISVLFNTYKDPQYAVYCVQHNFVPRNKLKMDGKLQQPYQRKLWSSFILWNLDHPSNKKLTMDDVNHKPGLWLHNFSWLKDEEIGALPEVWNWLPKISPTLPPPKNGKPTPHAIHFTEGGPWWDNYKGVEFADKWELEYNHYVASEMRIKKESIRL